MFLFKRKKQDKEETYGIYQSKETKPIKETQIIREVIKPVLVNTEAVERENDVALNINDINAKIEHVTDVKHTQSSKLSKEQIKILPKDNVLRYRRKPDLQLISQKLKDEVYR